MLRGRAGRIDGLLVAGFVMMKGLPSGYNRDFHEEKEILWEAFDLINRAVEIIPALISTTTINKERMRELTFANFSTATELANFLVRDRNVPFRKAHHIVGSLVGNLTRSGDNFNNYGAVQTHLKEHEVEATVQELQAVLDGALVMRTYNSLGGTGPESVRSMIKVFHEQLAEHQAAADADHNRIESAYKLTLQIAETGNFDLAKQ